MCCNSKKNFNYLKGSTKQAFPLIMLWVFLMPFFLLLHCSALKRLALGSGGELCIGDCIDSLNSGYIMNFFILLFTSAIIFIISGQNTTANFILRLHSRKCIVKSQCIKSICLSLIFSVCLILISFLVSGLMVSSLINWSEQSSSFYQSQGYTLNISLLNVVVLTSLRIFLKLLFFTSAMVLISLRFKKIISFLAAVVLSAVRFPDLVQFAIENIFNLHGGNECFPISMQITYICVLPALIVLFFCLSFRMIKRKDFIVT